MKKFYYSLFAAATLLLATTSCSQEEDFAQSSGELTTFSIQLNEATQSRAVGEGTQADKLYYAVYQDNEKVYPKDGNGKATFTDKKVKFDLPLLKGETYDIIFWAQNSANEVYNIDDLAKITVDYTKTVSNQDSYDAFYNALNDFKADGKEHTVKLRRPFAQLNLGTGDWEAANQALKENSAEAVTHSSVVVSGLANTFEPLLGKASGNVEATFSAGAISKETFTVNVNTYTNLSFNYLLVPCEQKPNGEGNYIAIDPSAEKALVDVTYTLYRGEGNALFTMDKISYVPVQRNYRTNIVGNLLTGTGFDIEIKPEEDGSLDNYDYLKEVLTKGGEVTLLSDITLTEDITIPEDITAKINLNGNTLTVKSGDNIVNGNLNISNGDVEIDIDGESEVEVAFWAKNGSKVELDDVVVEVAANNVAVAVDQNGEATININKTQMTVGNGGHGISMPFGAKDVTINVTESTLSGYYAFYLYATNATVTIDEESSINKFWVMGGNVTVKHAGAKPEINQDGLASTITYVPIVSSSEGLINAIKAALESGESTIILADGTYQDNIDLTVASLEKSGDLVFKAAEGATPVIAGTVTLGYRNQGVGATMWNGDVTFEGITFDHANAATHSLDVQDVKSLTLKNCKIIGDGEYGLTSARGNATGTSSITGCTFENAGMQLLGNFATGLVIDGCTFNESRINVQAGNGVTVQNCNFTNTLTSANVDDSFYLIRSNSTPITVKGCNIDIDSELADVATNQAKWYILANRGTTNWTVENVAVTMTEAALKQTELFVTKCTSTGVINTTNLTVNGKGYASTAAQLNSAVDTATEIYVQGEFKMPSNGTSKAITISSLNGNATIDNTLGSYWDNATLTFNNVKFKTSTGYANGNGSDYAALYSKNVTYNKCSFSGPMRLGRDGAKFIECTFNDLGNDYVWTYGNAATFQGCTFNSAGKALLIYSDGGNGAPAVSVTGCTFKATQGAKAGAISNQNCAAIEIHNYGYGVTLTTSGNTVETEGDKFSGEWRIKTYETRNADSKIFVNGTEYTTLALDGKTMTIDGTNVTVQP